MSRPTMLTAWITFTTLTIGGVAGGGSLAGCRQLSSFDKLVQKVDSAESVQFTLRMVSNGKAQEPITIQAKSKKFFSVDDLKFQYKINPSQGYFEVDHEQKLYYGLSWKGAMFTTIDKLLPTYFNSFDVFGLRSLSQLGIPADPWKKIETKNGIDRWQKILILFDQKIPVEVFVDSDGNWKEYLSPQGFRFKVESVKLNLEIADSVFEHQIRDGYTEAGSPDDNTELAIGSTFDISKLKKGPRGQSFQPKQPALFVLLDPTEGPSQPVRTWNKKSLPGIEKYEVLASSSGNDFFDPNRSVLDGWVSSLPFFVLVDSKMKIRAIWLGFDPTQIPSFEKDIKDAISEMGTEMGS